MSSLLTASSLGALWSVVSWSVTTGVTLGTTSEDSFTPEVSTDTLGVTIGVVTILVTVGVITAAGAVVDVGE